MVKVKREAHCYHAKGNKAGTIHADLAGDTHNLWKFIHKTLPRYLTQGSRKEITKH